MCGFLLYNFLILNDILTKANELLKLRGPDDMNVFNYSGYTFIHNVLSITGEKTLQPFIEESKRIVCLYNGEIYNYKEFNKEYKSDGECIIPMYLKHGHEYASHLDGEFAIVIINFETNELLLSSDIFGTKPMYYAFESDGRMGIASYKSCLINIGLKNIEKMSCNFTKVFKMDRSFAKSKDTQLYDFDLNQHKQTYHDFANSLRKSIEKRCKNVDKNVFVSLSSGYDSGLICGILNELNIKYNTICLDNNRENMITVNKRIILNKSGNNHVIKWNNSDHKNEYTAFLDKISNMNYFPTSPSFAACYICDTAKKNNYKINISGHGVDEIMSDYFGSSVSNFKGIFPINLYDIFPKNSEDNDCVWKNFYNKSMLQNLEREEIVGGSFGIETRYPFLDKFVVQEFLWLETSLKNKFYKAPLKEYLETISYPFDLNKKIGLSS